MASMSCQKGKMIGIFFQNSKFASGSSSKPQDGNQPKGNIVVSKPNVHWKWLLEVN